MRKLFHHEHLLRFLPLIFVGLFLLFFTLLSNGTFNRPTTTASEAQEAWKCPGNQCDRCGYQGWWAAGCDVFCAANPGKALCTKIDGPLTPCGGFAKMCNFPSEDGKTSCIVNQLWKCGNDSCYHLVEPVNSCGVTPTEPAAVIPTAVVPTLTTQNPTPFFNLPTFPQNTSATNTTTKDTTQAFQDMLQSFLNLPYTLMSTAQNAAQNPSPTLNPANPAQLFVQSVNELVTKIRETCIENGIPGVVSIRNVTCLSVINPPIAINTKLLLMQFATYTNTDGTPWDHIQCVGFARAVSSLVSNESGEEICNRQTSGGVAIGCAKDSVNYRFVRNYDNIPIKVGDYPIWQCPPEKDGAPAAGHIAYVVEVYNANNIQVAEANWDGKGTVATRNVEITSSPVGTNPSRCLVTGWLTKKI